MSFMVKASKKAIIMTRGDTGMIAITVTDEDSGEEIKKYRGKFTVKKNLRDNFFVLQKPIIKGEIAFDHQDTQTMDYGDYLYDIEITSEEQVSTFGPYQFTLLPDVTTR